MRIVDEAQQGPLRGDLRQQAERGQGDEEAVRRWSRRQPEGDAQGVLLGLGQRAELREHRRAELVQSGEGQLHLGLDTRDLRDSEAGRLPGAVAQERRLAHSGLTTDDEDRALAATGIVQQPVEHATLGGPAAERRGALSGHAPQSVTTSRDARGA